MTPSHLHHIFKGPTEALGLGIHPKVYAQHEMRSPQEKAQASCLGDSGIWINHWPPVRSLNF